MALVALCALSADTAAETPHPAVVRVIAPERGGASLGSGTLVGVSEGHGLVVTNWHVVRDAAGPVTVVFPDGFRSGATVMKIDRDWDLAALAIWRPKAAPVPIATRAPQPGEPLTIAGYGQGSYRATAGRCVQYVAPQGNFPHEMVELSTGARQGDSGGPIFNSYGELAGVLFGSAFGRTTGTFCRRVQWFLEEPFAMLERLPANPTMLAEAKKHEVDPSPVLTTIPERSCPVARLPEDRDADPAALLPLPDGERDPQLAELSSELPDRPKQRISLEDLPEAKTNAEKQLTAAVPAQSHLPTRADQIKNILAVIGLIAVLFHGLRFLALAAN